MYSADASLELYIYSVEENGLMFEPEHENTPHFRSILDTEERNRYFRYKFDHSRGTFFTARWIAKTQLAKKLDCLPEDIRFNYNENGKPFLHSDTRSQYSNLHFSIAHTKTMIAFSVANFEHGVDVEKINQRGQVWQKSADFLNEHIAQKIDAIENDHEKKLAFARYWTCMEARVKLTGTTLFSIKQDFGRRLPSLLRDGVFSDDDTWYFTATIFKRSDINDLGEAQLSVCTSRPTFHSDVFMIKDGKFLKNIEIKDRFLFGQYCDFV